MPSHRFRLTATTTQYLRARATKLHEATIVHADSPDAETERDLDMARDHFFKGLAASWFDERKRSTRAMRYGARNEEQLLASVLEMKGVQHVVNAGMYCRGGDEGFIAASPDAFAVLTGDGGEPFVVGVELKTATNVNTLAKARAIVDSANLNAGTQGRTAFRCSADGDKFAELIPNQLHRGQIRHQALALGLGHTLYCVGNTRGDVVYTVLVHFGDTAAQEAYLKEVRQMAHNAGIHRMHKDYHPDVDCVPPEVPPWLSPAWRSHCSLWHVVELHVASHGPLPPVFRFLAAIQIWYNR